MTDEGNKRRMSYSDAPMGPNKTLTQQALEQVMTMAMNEEGNPPAPQPEEKSIGFLPYAALFTGQGADMATTFHALNNGFHEANPIMGSTPGRIGATKAGMTAGMALLMHLLDKQGKDGVAKALGYIGGIGGAIPAALNMRAMSKK